MQEDPDKPIIDWLQDVIANERAEAKYRIDAAVAYLYYITKWVGRDKLTVAKASVREVMRTIALDPEVDMPERIRAAGVAL